MTAFEFAGMDRFEARKAVVAKLEEIGALVKIENVSTVLVTQNVQVLWLSHACLRNGSSRWTNWPKCHCQPRHRRQGRILPTSFQRYLPPMDGKSTTGLSSSALVKHQIPAWYNAEGEMYVGEEAPEGDGWTQDEDVLILGSVLPFGHSQPWVGLMLTQKTSSATSQLQPW